MRRIHIVVFFMACARGNVQDKEEPEVLQQLVCDEEADHSFDKANCGGCFDPPRACITTSDRCFEGMCMCGSNKPCPRTQECKLDTCVSPELHVDEGGNPEAITCEADHQCVPEITGRYCVRGVCSRVPCGDRLRSEICYTGPEGTQNNWPCKEGFMVCHDGFWTECREQVLPLPEVGNLLCDRVDNNCDGCKDGTIINEECIPSDERDVQVLFIVDMSGSMHGVCEAVVEAMNRLGGWLGDDRYRFALVLIPHSDSACKPGIYINFSRFNIFEEALGGITCRMSAEDEPSWDAVYHAARNDEMYDISSGEMSRLSWRDDATHVIIMFTDEKGQSYTEEGCREDGPVNEALMCSALDDTTIAVVTKIMLHAHSFDDCALIYEVVPDAVEMSLNLQDIFEEACAG